MYVLFYFISNWKIMAMLVVYLILFDFDEIEPLFSADNLDKVEKTPITKIHGHWRLYSAWANKKVGIDDIYWLTW